MRLSGLVLLPAASIACDTLLLLSSDEERTEGAAEGEGARGVVVLVMEEEEDLRVAEVVVAAAMAVAMAEVEVGFEAVRRAEGVAGLDEGREEDAAAVFGVACVVAVEGEEWEGAWDLAVVVVEGEEVLVE